MVSDNITLQPQKLGDISHYGRLKKFPDGSWELLAASKPIFRDSGFEERKEAKPKVQSGKRQASDLERARRRAAAKVRDIARCTRFRWFVTLTFAPDRVNRYSATDILRLMRTWLDNRVRRNGLAYILVPEFHKDGAVHFHGFFNDADIGIVDSGTLRLKDAKQPRRPRSEKQRQEWLAACAQPVYNITEFVHGFSTAIEIYGDYNAAISYCCKYIGKQTEKIGGRWYYSGGKLGRPEIELVDVDFYQLKDNSRAYTFVIEAANVAFAMVKSSDSSDLDGENLAHAISECDI